MPHYIRDFVPGGPFFFTVALIDRDADAIEQAAKEIGSLAQPFAADVTDEAGIGAVMADIARKHGCCS
ncbi:hypothetical protein [Hydrocarboniphaga sp.]|uniref:hypothetical protein n=1 Tax=Hydrocarboniphaga sp. TaxID=2033016 RepID=UPI0026147205|nr:hypothetical protein [Hydrocarboniphaga sp.]